MQVRAALDAALWWSKNGNSKWSSPSSLNVSYMILLCIGRILSFTSVIRLYRPSTVLRYGLPFWLPCSVTRFYQLAAVRVSITLSHFDFLLPSPASFHHLPPKCITERKDLAILDAPCSTFGGCQESPNDSALPTLSSPLSESAQIPPDDPAIPCASELRAVLHSRRTRIYVQDWTCQRWLDPHLVTALRLISASSSGLRSFEDQQFEKPPSVNRQSKLKLGLLALLVFYNSKFVFGLLRRMSHLVWSRVLALHKKFSLIHFLFTHGDRFMEKEVECDQMSFAAGPHETILDQGSCLRPPPFSPVMTGKIYPFLKREYENGSSRIGTRVPLRCIACALAVQKSH